MECLRGGSLHRLLKARGSLPLPDAASIAAKVGQALEFIHAKRVAHNDIKPDNVLFRRPLEVGQPYEPVLIDFGIATRSKKLMIDYGSLQYMAPERIVEIRHPSPPERQAQDDPYKADVWSLSVLFYNMLVGQEPFAGLTEKSVTTAIQRATPKGLANFKKELPAELDEFITEQCLAKEPRWRPSMKQFVRFVERYQQDGRVTQAPSRGLKLPWQK
jgi:serine/threonine protein kinase